jgi:NTP pyrophosphatase (non-canonical NTP hydrolase)
MEETLSLADFAKQIARTDKRPSSDALRIAVLGLFGELGSLMSEVKKEIREGPSYLSYKSTLVEEAGDLLWYFGALATTLGIPIHQVVGDAVGCEVTADEPLNGVQSKLSYLPRSSSDHWLHAGRNVGLLADHVASYGRDEHLPALVADALRAVLIAFDAAEIGLSEAVAHNVNKSLSRFPLSRKPLPLYDDRKTPDGGILREDERLPRFLPFDFEEIEIGARKLVVQKVFQIKIGDPLTDNIGDPDDYRFHDVFHIAYAAILGWSPVLRSLLKVKRKSYPHIDENQDGARATLIEEGISTFVFNHAKPHLFAGATGVDYRLLSTIKEFVRGYEVEDQPFWAWERAILRGYDVFRQLKVERRGRVTMDLTSRDISFESVSA